MTRPVTSFFPLPPIATPVCACNTVMITLLFGSHSMHALTIGRANPVSQPIDLPTTHNERSTPAPNEWAAVSIGINLPPRFASECLAPVLARAHDRSRSVVLLLAHHQLA